MRPIVLGMEPFAARPGGLARYVDGLSAALPSSVVTADPELPLLRRLLRFAREVAAAEGDLLDAHFALYALLPVLRRRGRPLVVHFHGPWADEARAAGEGWLRAAVKRRVERAVYRRADALVTLSQAFKRLLVERYGVSPWRVNVIPPGVDLERFSPGDRAAARARLELPAGERVVAAVRRRVPRMGLEALTEAKLGLAAIAGEGPSSPAGSDSVRLLGRLDDESLVALYRAADVTVVPSRELEGFGLVALESLACGTPVVVTDVGGLPEAVAGLDRSLVVPPGDPAALERRLNEPLPSAEACRTHAERFSWASVAARHLDLYGRLHQAERPLRVVYLDHTAVLSGGELALLRLLPALPDVEPHVILGEDGPLARRLAEAGVSAEVLPMPPRARGARRGALSPLAAAGAALYALRLARRLRQLRPDLVHTNSLKAGLYGGTAARLARIPLVWHLRDRVAEDSMSPREVRLVRRAALRLPRAVIADTESTLATLPGVHGHVVPSPIVVDAGAKESGPFVAGMVGRVAPWKGQHVFVEAFARAFPEGREQAVIVGAPLFGADEETYLASVRALGERLRLNGRLHFSGFSDRVEDELARMDVLVHASVRPEPFGQVVLEGMAAGLPVVAAAAGGPAEVIEDGVDGLLYPPGDADALAERLRALAGDEELRRRLGDAGRRKAAAYTPGAVAARVRAVYDEVLGR